MFATVNNLLQAFRAPSSPLVSGMLLKDAQAEDQARKNAMQKAWRAYYGELPEPLRVKLNQPNDNILMNFARLVVDKGVSFLFGQEVEFTVDDSEEEEDDDEAPNPAEDYLKLVWKHNKKQTLLHRLATNGAVTGHVFVKVVMVEGRPLPRLVVLDPSTVSVLWEPDDYEHIVEYRIEWNALSPENGKPVALRQVITQEGNLWQIIDQHSVEGKAWITDNEATWPYTWSPVFHCQNLPAPNSFWGVADLSDDVLKLLNSRNFIASNMSRIIRYHGHPKTYATGMGPNSSLELSVDGIAFLPNPAATLKNLEMGGDLSSMLEYLRYLDDQLLSLANVPPIALGKFDSSGPLSGVALRIHYQPLLERNSTKQMLYGDMFCALNTALLELGGFGTEHDCEVEYANVLPVDTFQQAQEALIIETLGVASKDTLAARLGFDYDVEKVKIAQEKSASADATQTAFDRGNVPGGGNNPATGAMA